MKVLVTVLSIASVASAIPTSGYGAPTITAGYGTPLAPVIPAPAPVPIAPVAPIQEVNIPLAGPPVIEPVFASRALPFAARPTPFAPRALPFAPRALPFGPRGLPLTAAPISPVAQALPVAPRALPVDPRALPLTPAPISPIARALPVGPVAVPAVQSVSIARAAPLSVPSTQFQAQDDLGGFSFGYQNENSAKEEVRTADGVTRGAYSYVDANGAVQRVEYIADDINGFRVVGSNLPVAASAPVLDTPEVAAAKAEFQLAFDAATARAATPVVVDDVLVEASPVVPVKATLQLRKKRSALDNGYGAPLAPAIAVNPAFAVTRALPTISLASRPIAAPFTPATLPLQLAANPAFAAVTPVARALPIPAPVATPLATPVALPKAVITNLPSSQYQAQDEFGGVSFGYQNQNSARQEVRSPDGSTQGSYSYVDANGVTQTVNYIADALGYRIVDATNLPVAVAA